jgi:phosphoglycerol transferase
MLWIVAALLAVGILDETSTVWQFAPRYREEKAEFEAAKEFTAAVEPSVDAGAMIYQIPYAPFFEAGPVKGMNDYAHLMPFLFSERGLKWSYGALRGSAGEALATSLNAMPPPLLLESLCTRGFQGIYIDRWGMGDDDTELETQVSLLLHKAPIVSSDQHRAFFSLRGFTAGSFAGTSADDIRKRAAELQKLLVVSWDRGCYALEGTSGANHRWCSASGELSIKNLGPRPVRADFTMALFTGDANPSPVSIVLPSGAVREFQVGSAGVGVKLSDVIPPGAWKMRIATTAKRVDAPGDPRDLHLRLGDFSILSNGLRIY